MRTKAFRRPAAGHGTGQCVYIENRFLCSVFSVYFAQRVLKVRYSGAHMPLACVQSVVTVTGKSPVVTANCNYRARPLTSARPSTSVWTSALCSASPRRQHSSHSRVCVVYVCAYRSSRPDMTFAPPFNRATGGLSNLIASTQADFFQLPTHTNRDIRAKYGKEMLLLAPCPWRLRLCGSLARCLPPMPS
jgi:hypothetical protein